MKKSQTKTKRGAQIATRFEERVEQRLAAVSKAFSNADRSHIIRTAVDLLLAHVERHEAIPSTDAVAEGRIEYAATSNPRPQELPKTAELPPKSAKTPDKVQATH